jgi:hypothetical protein
LRIDRWAMGKSGRPIWACRSKRLRTRLGAKLPSPKKRRSGKTTQGPQESRAAFDFLRQGDVLACLTLIASPAPSANFRRSCKVPRSKPLNSRRSYPAAVWVAASPVFAVVWILILATACAAAGLVLPFGGRHTTTARRSDPNTSNDRCLTGIAG